MHQELSSVLLPYQQKWIADDSPVKVWEKSRRIGATWCEAADNVLTASSKNGQNTWFISANKDMAIEYIQDAANWARSFQQAASEVEEFLFEDETEDGKRSIQSYRIKFASGYRVTALSSRPTNLRGKQGICSIDESAFHENLPGLIKAAMAFLMWGGKVRIFSTHFGEDNYFNEIIKDIRAGRKNYSLHSTTLDDALEQGLFQRISLIRGIEYSKAAEADWRQEIVDFYGEHADEELFCIPTNSSGSYFPRILIENCMDESIPVLNLTLKDEFILLSEKQREAEVNEWLTQQVAPLLVGMNPHYKSSYGFDFGRTGDLSYLLPFQELPNLVRKALFALELRNVPFDQQKQILFYIVDRLPRLAGGAHDATGNGGYLAEAAATRYGIHKIEQIKLTLDWYRDNMPKYKAGLEDRKVLLPACSNLIDDHRAVQVIKGIPKLPDIKNKGNDGKLRHGDGAIAAALAWYASSLDNGNVRPAIGSIGFGNYQFS